jgi:hypothetical protein
VTSLEKGKPCRVVARCRDVIIVHGNHREDGAGAKDVGALVGDTLLPRTSVDELVPK